MSSITQSLNRTNNEFNTALSKQKGSNLDKDSFMLLLVTQFKYQDPLNPMEDKEFIAQMAQFSSLEQLMNLNTSMEGLTNATNNQQMINATSYIGKQVTVSGNTIGKVTDETTKESTITRFRYAPADNTVGGTITVRDADNNVVYVEEVSPKNKGTTYEFLWNGKATDGTVAGDGVYTVNLVLRDSNGDAVLSDQVMDAKVTGVVNDGGVVYLGLEGGQLMPLANVRQVAEPATVAAKPDDKDKEEGEDKESEDDKDEEQPESRASAMSIGDVNISNINFSGRLF
ncbi:MULTISPECIES: flagellar hook assembly protein FlgD [Desulfovibrio]|uniref:Basal-body rod modification protein FlgD n=1 Tax=Desulfovibrio desulfuricans TaxID=876 RepID=A0AA94HTY8_DESDE|nr:MULTISPECIES: flagellar hook assembly protein FlgD [Desulfovibrio]ATD81397.1 flagellar hook capping protein [Desulfovibrio sp. G11]SFW61704.1 flagellar basal-body rod modification protein FlgD [Desulfovibrio desulfuricans]SPD37058.1 Flagellar hook capping protein [Desulfovibrio sp. G11]